MQQSLNEYYESKLDNSHLLSEASPSIISAAIRIGQDLQLLEGMLVEMENPEKLSHLRSIQIACVEVHLNSMVDHEYKYSRRSKYPYRELINFLQEFISEAGPRPSLGRMHIMMCAHPASHTLESHRVALLKECYTKILLAEHQQEQGNADADLNSELAKIEQTSLLARQLFLGEMEGKFPPVEDTCVAAEARKFFDNVWVYLRNSFYIRPLGYFPSGHYDRNFYTFLVSLTQGEGAISKVDPLWQDFERLSRDYICPQLRLTELFRSLDSMVSRIKPFKLQLKFKSNLLEFAKSYGYQELSVQDWSFNSDRRRICFAHTVRTLRGLSLLEEKEHVGQGKVLKSVADLDATESEFFVNISKFIRGEERGGLKTLFLLLNKHELTNLQRNKLKSLEGLYAGLLSHLHEFLGTLSACVSSENSLLEKLNLLYAIVMGNDREKFTNYMLHLTVSALFLGKFFDEIKALLKATNLGLDAAPFERNMARSFQHLGKIADAFQYISCMVKKEEWAGDQILQAELMHKRVRYFSGVADILRDFVMVDDFVNPGESEQGDPEVRRQALEEYRQGRHAKFVEYIGSAHSVVMYRISCNRWLDQWEYQGVLPLDDIMTTIRNSISSNAKVGSYGPAQLTSGGF
jgi:hypothetical protein